MTKPQTPTDGDALVAGIHPDILKELGVIEKADSAIRLLTLVASEHPGAISCDDPRLDPFTDDFFGRDTCNLLFDVEWIDQIGSGELDDFRIVLMPKGLAVSEEIQARALAARAAQGEG